jgi:hypothetical protein
MASMFARTATRSPRRPADRRTHRCSDDQRQRGEQPDHTQPRCCFEFPCPLRGRARAHQSCVTRVFGRNIVKLCSQAEPAAPRVLPALLPSRRSGACQSRPLPICRGTDERSVVPSSPWSSESAYEPRAAVLGGRRVRSSLEGGDWALGAVSRAAPGGHVVIGHFDSAGRSAAQMRAVGHGDRNRQRSAARLACSIEAGRHELSALGGAPRLSERRGQPPARPRLETAPSRRRG